MKHPIIALCAGVMMLSGRAYAMEYSGLDKAIIADIDSLYSQAADAIKKVGSNHPTVQQQYDIFITSIKQACGQGKLTRLDVFHILKALSFAADKHATQTCKDAAQTPYIIHPIGVANTILSLGKVYDAAIIMGGLLHDTVEDTQTTFDELEKVFGLLVTGYVREVTDDKELQKEERKRLQIDHAAHTSVGAAIIKLSDKLNNLRDLSSNPPADWDSKRITEYFQWSYAVVSMLPQANDDLKNEVDKVIGQGFHRLLVDKA